eukprot:4512678-Prymnesium_polylepis.1
MLLHCVAELFFLHSRRSSDRSELPTRTHRGVGTCMLTYVLRATSVRYSIQESGRSGARSGGALATVRFGTAE